MLDNNVWLFDQGLSPGCNPAVTLTGIQTSNYCLISKFQIYDEQCFGEGLRCETGLYGEAIMNVNKHTHVSSRFYINFDFCVPYIWIELMY